MREIKIDFDNPGLPQRLDVVENDAQSRFFKAVLYKDGKAYAAPSGVTYSIMYRGFGPQNEGWYDTINDGAGKRAACSVSGNVVTCEIARQALRVPGHVSVVLCVTGSNGYMLHGWPIDCNCRNDNYTCGTSVESFFYITQVTNADWTSAIQTWEELKNMIDPTLSVEGKAADAAKVGEEISTIQKSIIDSKIQDVVTQKRKTHEIKDSVPYNIPIVTLYGKTVQPMEKGRPSTNNICAISGIAPDAYGNFEIEVNGNTYKIHLGESLYGNCECFDTIEFGCRSTCNNKIIFNGTTRSFAWNADALCGYYTLPDYENETIAATVRTVKAMSADTLVNYCKLHNEIGPIVGVNISNHTKRIYFYKLDIKTLDELNEYLKEHPITVYYHTDKSNNAQYVLSKFTKNFLLVEYSKDNIPGFENLELLNFRYQCKHYTVADIPHPGTPYSIYGFCDSADWYQSSGKEKGVDLCATFNNLLYNDYNTYFRFSESMYSFFKNGGKVTLLYRLKYPQITYYENDLMVFGNNIKTLSEVDHTIAYTRKYQDNAFLLPAYYSDYMEAKINEINAKIEKSLPDGDAFIFITDAHWENQNQKRSLSMINQIWTRAKIQRLFSGGDTGNGGSEDFCKSLRESFGGKIYHVVGNHDCFTHSNAGYLYKIFDISNTDQVGNLAEHYYYVDNIQSKIRYIVLSAFLENGTSTWKYGYNSEQVSWLTNIALNVQTGWTIIIFTHTLFSVEVDNYSVSFPECQKIINALESYAGNGTIACVLQGHTHRDRIIYLSTGIPVISVTSDKNLPYYPNDSDTCDLLVARESGTTNEQAFEVVILDKEKRNIELIRIGAKAQNGIGKSQGEQVESRIVNY